MQRSAFNTSLGFLIPTVAAVLVTSDCFSTKRHDVMLEESREPRLLQSHIIFRHGARTPVFWNPKLANSVDVTAFRGKCQEVNSPPGVAGAHAYPSVFKAAVLDVRDLDGKKIRPKSRVDSFQLQPIYGECRAGQLTTLGAEQSAKLGKDLRERYGLLAHVARERNRLWVRTSNVARCVATLQFVLGEFFFDDDDQGRLDEEERVFITFTAPNESEWLYPNSNCSLMAQLMFAAKQDWSQDPGAEAKMVVEKLKKRVSKETADALRLDDYNFVRVRDYLVAYEEHGLPVPWIRDDPELYRKIIDLGAYQIARYLYHENEPLSYVSARAGVGNLLKLLFSAILNPTESTQIVSIISGHDTTLMPIMSACGAWDGKTWPGFCSWIAFELWSDNKVRLIFDGKVAKTFSLEEFAKLAEQLAPKDGEPWEEYCKQEHPSIPSLKNHSGAAGDHW
jgi:hypothetical protein